MTNKIAWEPWEEKPVAEIPQIEDNVKDTLEENEPELDFLNFGLGIIPKVRTPWGFFSTDDPMSPLRMFECWVGHVNFEITEEIAKKIEFAQGVGAFKVLSRYRFFIGVEKLFDFRDVRQEIQNTVIGSDWKKLTPLNDDDIALYDDIISNKRWAVVFTTEGKIVKYISTNEDVDKKYDSELTNCKENKEYWVISSEDI